MGICARKIRVVGDLTLSIDLTKNNQVVLSLHDSSLPPISFPEQKDNVIPGLMFAGSRKPATDKESGSANIDTLGYTGQLGTKSSIKFDMDFYCDCNGPYCINFLIKDIKFTVSLEYDTPGPNWDLVDVEQKFNDIKEWDCKEPEWKKCCGESGVDIEFEIDEHPLPNNVLLSLSGEAVLDYEIWHKPSSSSTRMPPRERPGHKKVAKRSKK